MIKRKENQTEPAVVDEPVAETADQPVNEMEQLRSAAKASADAMMQALHRADELSEQLAAAQTQAATAQDQYLRTRAEYENFRKRSVQEKAAAFDQGAMDTLTALLPTLDNLERALDIARSSDAEAIAQGIELTVRQLMEAFDKKGLKEIDAVGKPFDPNLHAAVMREPNDDPEKSDTVAQVLQKGYVYHDRVLRYSSVKVYM